MGISERNKSMKPGQFEVKHPQKGPVLNISDNASNTSASTATESKKIDLQYGLWLSLYDQDTLAESYKKMPSDT